MNPLLQSIFAKLPEIAANVGVSRIERELNPPTRFSETDRKQSRVVRRALERSAETADWAHLKKPAGRKALLAAAKDHLEDEGVEWVILGLGTSSRSRSFVTEVYARRGSTYKVTLPASVQARMTGQLSEQRGEVIHIHNHPDGLGRELKNAVLGEHPITSDADREVQQALANHAAQGSGRVRCFLVENQRIHEYSLPTKGVLRDIAETAYRMLRKR